MPARSLAQQKGAPLAPIRRAGPLGRSAAPVGAAFEAAADHAELEPPAARARSLGFSVDESKADAYTMPATGFLPTISNAAIRRDDWEHIVRPVARLVNGRAVRIAFR